jgi:hypothetical protein
VTPSAPVLTVKDATPASARRLRLRLDRLAAKVGRIEVAERERARARGDRRGDERAGDRAVLGQRHRLRCERDLLLGPCGSGSPGCRRSGPAVALALGIALDLVLIPALGASGAEVARPRRRAGTRRCTTGSRAAQSPSGCRRSVTVGPHHIQAFFDHRITAIPTPLTPEDRAASYWWELSMRQVEVSRTLVFDDPRRARSFFEALVADNIGIGRPEEVSLVFARQVRKTTREPFGTRVLSTGT